MIARRRFRATERHDEFRALYIRNYSAIAAYVRRRLHPDTSSDADIIAEVFVVAWRRLTDVPTQAQELPWLYGVARNLVASHFRGTQRVSTLIDRLSVEQLVAGNEEMPGDLEVRAQWAINHLSETDREVFRLIHWEGLSHNEVAAVLGLSAKAVERRVARARVRVRELLAVPDSTVTSLTAQLRVLPTSPNLQRKIS